MSVDLCACHGSGDRGGRRADGVIDDVPTAVHCKRCPGCLIGPWGRRSKVSAHSKGPKAEYAQAGAKCVCRYFARLQF